MLPFRRRLRKRSDVELLQTQEHNARKSHLLQNLIGPGAQDDPYSHTYYRFLVAQINSFDINGDRYNQSFATILDLPHPSEQEIVLNEVLGLIENFGKAIRELRGKRLSLEGILASALLDRGQDLTSLDPEDMKKAYQSSFAIIGWLSMLYEPSRVITPGLLSMSIPDQTADIVASRNVASVKRSLSTILSEFGHSLPIISPGDIIHPLHATSLSFRALSVFGKVRIIWSSDLCAHLQFNATNRTLVLFRLPSFCAMCCIKEDPCGLTSE
jgi:hypothetical protein